MTTARQTVRSWSPLVRHILTVVAAADPARDGWEERAGDALTDEFCPAPGPGDRLRTEVFEFLFWRVQELERLVTPEDRAPEPEPETARNYGYSRS